MREERVKYASSNAIRETQAYYALEYLIKARDLLKVVGAPKTLKRVRAAISSAKGAVRAASYRDARYEREQSAR